MKPRTVLFVVMLILIAIFVLANWTLLASPAQLNLIITTVRAPGGIVGLLIVAIILLIDWSTHAMNRRAWDRERRQLKQEVERARAQAEEVEASRLRTLQETVDRELSAIRLRLDRLAGPRESAGGDASHP